MRQPSASSSTLAPEYHHPSAPNPPPPFDGKAFTHRIYTFQIILSSDIILLQNVDGLYHKD